MIKNNSTKNSLCKLCFYFNLDIGLFSSNLIIAPLICCSYSNDKQDLHSNHQKSTQTNSMGFSIGLSIFPIFLKVFVNNKKIHFTYFFLHNNLNKGHYVFNINFLFKNELILYFKQENFICIYFLLLHFTLF